MYHIILELYWFNITDNSSSVPICDSDEVKLRTHQLLSFSKTAVWQWKAILLLSPTKGG